MSALDTELSRATARRSLTPRRTRRHDGEVLALPSASRATVVVAGETHTVSTAGLSVAAGSTVTVEWGSAIPRVVAVRTAGGSTVLAAPPSIPGDDLAAWVEDHLVPALVAAGVVTLA